MAYRASGHHARLLRTPGLRLGELEATVETFAARETQIRDRPDRAFFLHVLEGNLRLERPGHAPIVLSSGDSAGIEKGSRVSLSSGEVAAQVFVSSVPRRYAYIADLPDDVILITNDQASARLLKAVTRALVIELEDKREDEEIVRRLCEVIMLQLVRSVRANVVSLGEAPTTILHDQHILRAWSAYFSDPSADWTVEKLAEAAGLSRSAFFDRFRAIFGAPPLETLTRIRLEQVKQMLRNSRASLEQIANEIGYRSETALIRAFKREYGITPGQWRRDAMVT